MLYVKSIGYNTNNIFSEIKIDNSHIEIINRGLNIFFIDYNNLIVKYLNYDTFMYNHTDHIVNNIHNAYNDNRIYMIIIISFDECTCNISKDELADRLQFIGMNNFRNLFIRGSYYLIYDNKNKLLFDEVCDNYGAVIEKEYHIDNYISESFISIVCRANIYKFYIEYIESLMKIIKLNIIILISPADTFIKTDRHIHEYYFFCYDIPHNILNDVMLNNNNIKVGLLNTEQCSIEKFLYHNYMLLKNNIKIIDYSCENIRIMIDKIMELNNQQIDFNNILYLPYYINSHESNKLNINSNKIYDIGFCGSLLSQRRLHILNKLKESNISVKNIEGWNELRDNEFSNCKIILNIHFDNNYKIFENIRCDRLLYAKILIISEYSIYNNLLDLKDFIIFENYDNLIDKIKDVLKNYDVYYNNFLHKYQKYAKNIKNQRKKQILKTIDKLKIKL